MQRLLRGSSARQATCDTHSLFGRNLEVRRCMSHNVHEDASLREPIAYCSDLIRKRDYEAFLTSPFWPRDLRAHFIALRAFYVELATVPEAVSNPTIGKMRMQFWRDAVKAIGDGRPPRHPVALALSDACWSGGLPAYHLKRIIDARDAELHTPTHLTLNSLTAHAESTSSTFLYLLLSLLSLTSSSTLSHAASHLGIAQGIATLLRALPYHASQGRMVIPAEITARHGVSQEEVFRRGGHAVGIEDAVFEFATIANDNLLTSKEMFNHAGLDGKIPWRARPAFLSAVSARQYLNRLEAANFDAFDPSLQLRDWKLPWKIWRSYYKGSF
ncbi:uncharacterized protein FIBRA_05664 [Fibroporia radiculosa]|uniref:Phytoene synthase n=1 Tax=Fibroporia radiculosa TaxID=599839 RepID=J4GRE9_9APHY|nr:uncharacterized protein FIBRA_05664 [Fibroporia radiculosa]CCM03530.1 predicted protein [Fibroporia radiculosa]